MSEEDREFSKEYMGNAKSTDEELPWDFIRMSMESVANLAVTPMQEFLGLGTEARINYPSTLGNNWKWRLLPGTVYIGNGKENSPADTDYSTYCKIKIRAGEKAKQAGKTSRKRFRQNRYRV